MWLLIILICVLVVLTIAYVYAILNTRGDKKDKIATSISMILMFLAWFAVGGAVCAEVSPSIKDYNRGKVDTIIRYEVVNNDTINCDTIYKYKKL